MKDGILILNKPQDWTSHDCVAVCRRQLRLKGVKKIGHGGTLDPMAEGVLPIFIGQATRIMEYLELDQKTYLCQVQLGMVTDTQDIWGRLLEEHDGISLTQSTVLDALDQFRGEIQQIPPMYSAVRIQGRHLYEYAHAGKALQAEIKPRRVYIHDLTLEDMDLDRGLLQISVTCSKGTYIRTICHDLGQLLGCGGVMRALKRTAIGSITLDGSISPEQVKTADEQVLEQAVIPPDAPLRHFGSIIMPQDRARYFRQGAQIWLSQIRIQDRPVIPKDPITGEIPCNARGRSYQQIYKVYQQEDGMFLGTGFVDEAAGVLKADKMFQALNVPKGEQSAAAR